jgi:hypothetical protein
MRLKFKGSNQYVVLELNRELKEAKIATSKTHYKFNVVKWSMLFDKGRETIQDRLTSKLDDVMFKKAITLSMLKQGYQEVKDGSSIKDSE